MRIMPILNREMLLQASPEQANIERPMKTGPLAILLLVPFIAAYAEDNLLEQLPLVQLLTEPNAIVEQLDNGGFYYLDFRTMEGKTEAVLQFDLPEALEDGAIYIFSFEAKSDPPGSVIITLPGRFITRKDGEEVGARAKEKWIFLSKPGFSSAEFEALPNMEEGAGKIQLRWRQGEIKRGSSIEISQIRLEKAQN